MLCSISLNDLAGNFLNTSKHSRCRAVLTIHDGIVASLDRRDDYRCKFRPIEVFSNVLDIGPTPPANLPLVCVVDNKPFDRQPIEHWCRAWRKR